MIASSVNSSYCDDVTQKTKCLNSTAIALIQDAADFLFNIAIEGDESYITKPSVL